MYHRLLVPPRPFSFARALLAEFLPFATFRPGFFCHSCGSRRLPRGIPITSAFENPQCVYAIGAAILSN